MMGLDLLHYSLLFRSAQHMQKAFVSCFPNLKLHGLALKLIGSGKGNQSRGLQNTLCKENHLLHSKGYGNEGNVSVLKTIIRLKSSHKSLYVYKAADIVSQHLSDSTIAQEDLSNAKDIQIEPIVSKLEQLVVNDSESDLIFPRPSKYTEKKFKDESDLEERNILAKYLSDRRNQDEISNFNETLTAFINVCMYLGHEKEALRIFNYYIHVKPEIPSRRVTIISYNEVIKQMALQGNYSEMKNLVKELKKNSMQPNPHTFAHILSCLGHLQDKICVVEVEAILKWLQKEKISLEDVFGSALFPGDSLQYCLKAVQRVIPDVKQQLSAFDTSNESIKTKASYRNCLVDSLNESFFTNKVPSPAEGIITPDEILRLAEEQIKTECQGYVDIPSIYREERHSLEKTEIESELEQLEKQWRASIHFHLNGMKDLLREEFSKTENDYLNVFPFLCVLHEEQLLKLLIMNMKTYIRGNKLYSCSWKSLAEDLGDQCYQFYCQYHQKTSHLTEIYKKYCQSYLDCTYPESSYVPRVQWEKLLRNFIIEKNNSLKDYPPPWPYTVKLAVGRCLLDIIKSSVKMNRQGPPNSFFKKKIVGLTKTPTLTFPAAKLPMLAPPVPWTSLTSGGYVTSRSDFVRIMPHARQQGIQPEEGDTKALHPIFDSLNQMGAVPWKVNGAMLDVVKEVFLDRGRMEDIIMNPAKLKTLSMSTQQKLEKLMVDCRREQRQPIRVWSDMLYKLSIASFFRDKVIWLPLSVDFRGRAYTIHPYLSHYGDDATRSLLYFAQGKKLGPEGLAWLKLHLINLTGLMKRCTYEERLQYCEEVMNEILDSANNPLHGRLWWTQSDCPWQTLAACKELAAALRSGDPENYVSHLPIYQDASCNGLQHYAALARDKAGAVSVNLSASPIPRDAYSDVVEIIEEARKAEAEKGSQIAKKLEGLVQRKVIKQTVMATIHGRTILGAQERISKELKDLDLKDFPVSLAAEYLAGHILASIETLFGSAKAIQRWFINIAEGVCGNLSRNMEWVTPLGFQVVQPHSELATLHLQGKFDLSFDSNSFMLPDVSKQKNSFPPNFIQSLESSHMMLTSIYSQYAGITFVSIHDSFWTHAATVTIMKKICGEQFVSLHSLPILEDLGKILTKRFGDHPNFCKPLCEVSGDKTSINESLGKLLANVPKKGEFDLKEVLNSVYFCS